MIAVALDVKHGSFATESNADIFARDGSARLWDLNGNLLLTLKGHSKGVAAVTLDVEHGRLATSDDNTARLWDLQGNLLQTFEVGRGGPLVRVHRDRVVAKDRVRRRPELHAVCQSLAPL